MTPRVRVTRVAATVAASMLVAGTPAVARAQSGSGGGTISVGAQGTFAAIRVDTAERERVGQRYDSLVRIIWTLPPSAPERPSLVEELNRASFYIVQTSQLTPGLHTNATGAFIEDPGLQQMVLQTNGRVLDSIGPKGTLGFRADGLSQQIIRSDGLYIRHFRHPIVTFVEPNSPAGNAGIPVGGRVLSYNDRDLASPNPINLTRLLSPEMPVRVKVELNGQITDYPLRAVDVSRLQIRARSDGLVKAWRETAGQQVVVFSGQLPMPGPGSAAQPSIVIRRFPDDGPQTVGTMMPPTFGTVRQVAPPAPAPAPAWWGMAVIDLSPQERASADSPEGAFVARVIKGASADKWGVRVGDVVVSVGGVRVRSVTELQQRLDLGPGDRTSIELVREGKSVKVDAKRDGKR